MKETFFIISDGSCDIPKEEAARLHVSLVPFYISFQDKVYIKNVQSRKVFQRLVEEPTHRLKSAPPRVEDYVSAFLPLAGRAPILCVCMDSRLSRSFSHAVQARSHVLKVCPKAQIEIIDSGTKAILQGLLVQEAARLREQGHSFYGTTAILHRLKNQGRLLFTTGASSYRHKKEERHADKTLAELVRFLEKEEPKGFTMTIGYGYNYGDAENFRGRILKRLRKLGYNLSEKEIPIYRTGGVHGAHVGPFPLGVAVLVK